MLSQNPTWAGQARANGTRFANHRVDVDVHDVHVSVHIHRHVYIHINSQFEAHSRTTICLINVCMCFSA